MTTVRKRLRRLLPVAALTAAAVIAPASTTLATLGCPATANAAPGVWDIEAYDACVAVLYYWDREYWEKLRRCCEGTGGVWSEAKNDCVAPAAQENPMGPPPPPAGDNPPVNPGPDAPPKISVPTVTVLPPAVA